VFVAQKKTGSWPNKDLFVPNKRLVRAQKKTGSCPKKDWFVAQTLKKKSKKKGIFL